MSLLSPMRDRPVSTSPWEGPLGKKPWQYEICAAIPVMDTPENLAVVIDILRAQSLRPYIVVIDTGSLPDNWGLIDAMRAEDVEVHSLRLHGVKHPSDYPAIAMDLAMSLCRSPYLFATHADCFLRRKDLLEDMLKWCKDMSPVVGYEITPRAHNDWRGMVSHTCTMMEMKTMDDIGVGWSLRRLSNMFGIEDHTPDPNRPNWPDTELLLNYLLRANEIEPFLIGKEENFCRNVDENIDHCRTYTGSLLYSPGYHEGAKVWASDAIKEAKERIKKWGSSNS